MEKKQVKISGFIIAIGAIVLVSIIFLIVVQIPFMQKIDTYESKHKVATSQINSYNNYLNNQASIEAMIKDMQLEYLKKTPVLFDNATKSTTEIEQMLNKIKNVTFISLDVSKGNVDKLGRATVEGGALKSTKIRYVFAATEKDLYQTLDYLELTADGTYYIESVTVEDYAEDVEGTDSEGSKVITAKTSKDKFQYAIVMYLYYFENVTGLTVDTEVAAEASRNAAVSQVSKA